MLIHIDIEACKGCLICIDNCPKKMLELSTVRNKKGYLVPVVTDPDECSNCLACELLCPDMAVHVEEEEDAA